MHGGVGGEKNFRPRCGSRSLRMNDARLQRVSSFVPTGSRTGVSSDLSRHAIVAKLSTLAGDFADEVSLNATFRAVQPSHVGGRSPPEGAGDPRPARHVQGDRPGDAQ